MDRNLGCKECVGFCCTGCPHSQEPNFGPWPGHAWGLLTRAEQYAYNEAGWPAVEAIQRHFGQFFDHFTDTDRVRLLHGEITMFNPREAALEDVKWAYEEAGKFLSENYPKKTHLVANRISLAALFLKAFEDRGRQLNQQLQSRDKDTLYDPKTGRLDLQKV